MKKHFKNPVIGTRNKKIVAVCVGLLLEQMAAGVAYADSGVDVNTTVGNALNPRTVSSVTEIDPDGMGQTEFQRTPTGLLIQQPRLKPETTKNADGWDQKGWVEYGVLGHNGDTNNAKFKEYKDLRSGAYINNFGVEMEKPDEARYFEVIGGGVGRDDQYYQVNMGRYNDWKVKAFFTETPHVFTSTYRNLWNGVGTSNLTLKNVTGGMPAGGVTDTTTTNTRMRAEVNATPYSELSIIRSKYGVRADMNLQGNWKMFASYSNENKKGARPFGMTMGGGGGTGNVEIPESIDNDTHDFFTGLQWNDSLSSINLVGQASFFRNSIDTMTVQSPIFIAATGAGSNVTQARYDMHPNNDYYNVKGEYARSLPDFHNGRFTAVYSLGSMRNNDSLIPYTTVSGVAINNVSNGQWDTVNSLSQKTSNAQIDTRLIDLGLSFSPVNDLDVRTKFRHYETENKTEYWACNPQNGQWGRVLNDGSGASIVASGNGTATAVTGTAGVTGSLDCRNGYSTSTTLNPAAGNIPIRNIPYSYKQTNYTFGGDYRLNRNNSVNLVFEREEYHREHREREQTWENKLKLGYVNRSLENGTIRLSVENTSRRGSTYNSDPYEEFYSASLGILPTSGSLNSWVHVLGNLRKFDLADRDQNILNARLNYALREDLDGMVALQVKDTNYPDSQYGRIGRQKQNFLNFDLSWRSSDKLNLYGFYSFQNGSLEQSGLPSLGTGTCTKTGSETAEQAIARCYQAGSTLFPLANTWTEQQKDKNDTLGLGANYDFGWAKLDVSYTYVNGITDISYTAGSTLLTTAAAVAAAGNGFPTLKFKQNIVQANLMIPYDKKTTVHLLYRFENARIQDWHYDGVASNPVPGTTNQQQVYLDAGPQSYNVTVFGAMLKMRF